MAATTVVNPAVLNALTLRWGRDKADLDDQENRYRINYNGAMDKMRRTYDDTSKQSIQGFSDRGMLHSGPSTGQSVKLRDLHNRQQADAGQAFNTNLSTLARRRLDADAEFKNQTLLASLGLTAGA